MLKNLVSAALLSLFLFATADASFLDILDPRKLPLSVTGTINGTVAILPIPYQVARDIIPSEYPILQHAYQSLLPDFPKDMYPAMIQTVVDENVRAFGVKLPDFSRASIFFPFIDRLNDGYTSFSYGERILVGANNILIPLGLAAYGYTPTVATFDPKLAAYACEGTTGCSTTYFKAYRALHGSSGPKISHVFTRSTELSPYSIAFYKNITNQPSFSKSKFACDQFTRLFNTSETLPPHEPVVVRGTVNVVEPFFPETTTWPDVWGLQMKNSFIENNFVKCQDLQGYSFSD